ncbi:g6246 [Coccomyxa viridis]|uniref:Pyrophosphate--fructose 6-phosphate 1-phosphotransferase subunit beta n=1 Tax=Coccomyxa viridis TaxID=1274662 RepID=A0ABP1FZS3_9CHLO
MGLAPAHTPVLKKQKGAAVMDIWTNDSPIANSRRQWVPPRPAVLNGEFQVVADGVPKSPNGSGNTCDDKVKGAFPHLQGQEPVVLKSTSAGAALNGSSAPVLNGSASRTNGLQASEPKANSSARTLRVGIVLSGGQAPGGHNVIAGVLDYLTERHPGSTLLGFRGGPGGILAKDFMEITQDKMAAFRNQGGFHMIGSGRGKIEKAEDLQKAADVAQALRLDGLIVCGGDDSNTNAAVLAESFKSKGLHTGVVGVPKTIDGDLKNAQVATSFGFDTACKVYSEQIGNLMMDALSAKKYYHFVRLMGRAASHITLECALQTHPQAAIICEELHHSKQRLADIVRELADIVAARAKDGKNYGIILLPEGLIEHVPEIGALIQELNEVLADTGVDVSCHDSLVTKLTPANLAVFQFLPTEVRQQLLLDRDPHGNVQVARIETEKLLLQLLETELGRRAKEGAFSGKFAGLTHYFGYEGRCSMPTNFDATYCATLGYAAGALVAEGKTGLMATASCLDRACADWTVGGYPLVDMMCIERRRGKDKPVIRKALVELDGPVFGAYKELRQRWATEDAYRSPGPIQFEGPAANAANFTLSLELCDGQPINIA